MATGINWPPIGGTGFSIPAAGEVGWPALSNFLIALASAQGTSAQKIGMRTATTTPITAAATDCAIVVALATPGAAAVTLPAGVTGQVYTIIDGTGDAATNNITITPNGAETINGIGSYVMSTNLAAIELTFRGSGKWVLTAQYSTSIGGSILRTQIAAGTPDYVVINDGTGLLSQEARLAQSRGGFGTNVSAFSGVVKAAAGVFSAATIVNADISASAAIDATKIGGGAVSNTEFSYLDGVTSAIQTQFAATQPLDADLTALAALATTGLLARTAANTFTTRTITGTTNLITVTDGDGIAGNPTLTVGSLVLQTAASQVVSNKTLGVTNTVSLADTLFRIQDDGDNTKQLAFQASGITTGTTRTLTVQDASGTVALLTNTLNQFAATTSAQLLSTLTNPTGTGLAVFGTSPVITTPTLAGGTASNTSRWTVPSDTLANLTALTRVEGVIVYATDTDKFYSDDGTNLNEVGSGSSSGINYITSPNTATGWSRTGTTGAAGNVPVTTTTAGDLPLSPTITTAIKIVSAANAGSESVGYISFPVTTPASGGVKTPINFWMRPGTNFIASEWTVSVYQSTTRQVLSTDSSSVTFLPNGTGQFVTSFDALASTAYTLRFARTVNAGLNVGQLNLAQVFFGLQPINVGAAVGPYESTTSYTIGADTTPPTPGASPTYYRRTFRDADYAVIRWEFSQTGAGTAGSGNYRLPLPTGLTVDASRLGVATSSGYARVVTSTGFFNNSTTFLNIVAYALGGTSYVYGLVGNEITSPATGFGSTGGALSGAGTTVFALEARLPIAEWAGSGTLNIGAGASVQYLYNSSGITGANVSDTTSFAYGPNGAAIGSIASTTANGATVMRVRSQYPIQATDLVVVEVDQNSSGARWFEAGAARLGSLFQSTSIYGIYLSFVNSTDIDVSFGNKGFRSDGATYGSDGSAWSGISTWRWRVRIVQPSAPVGFGLAGIDGSSGLYKAGSAPGSITGTSAAQYCIGEKVTGTYTTTSLAVSGTTYNPSNISLTTGVWLIKHKAPVTAPGTTRTDVTISISVANTTATTNANNSVKDSSTVLTSSQLLTTDVYYVTATATYYATVAVTYTGTAPSATGGEFFAVRIA